MADDVQPSTEGQGADADSGLYDLDSVAPEVRDQLTPHLKKIEGNVTKRFQEAADYRKQWEPYEQLGLADKDPAQIKQLLDFAQLAQDPEQFKSWWEAAGKEMGFTDDKPVEEDDFDLDAEDFSAEKIQELIQKQVEEKVGPIQAKFQEQEKERLEAEANKEVDSALSEILDGKEVSDEDKEDILAFAWAYSDENGGDAKTAIQKGYERYARLVGQGANGLLAQKTNQPKPPEGEGPADTSAEKITSFKDPRLQQAGIEKLRAANAAG